MPSLNVEKSSDNIHMKHRRSIHSSKDNGSVHGTTYVQRNLIKLLLSLLKTTVKYSDFSGYLFSFDGSNKLKRYLTLSSYASLSVEQWIEMNRIKESIGVLGMRIQSMLSSWTYYAQLTIIEGEDDPTVFIEKHLYLQIDINSYKCRPSARYRTHSSNATSYMHRPNIYIETDDFSFSLQLLHLLRFIFSSWWSTIPNWSTSQLSYHSFSFSSHTTWPVTGNVVPKRESSKLHLTSQKINEINRLNWCSLFIFFFT